MKVYTTRFEGVSAFSTARKAIASHAGQFADLTEYDKIAPGAHYESLWVEITPENAARIIKFFHKKGYMNVKTSPNDYDTTYFEICEVQ